MYRTGKIGTIQRRLKGCLMMVSQAVSMHEFAAFELQSGVLFEQVHFLDVSSGPRWWGGCIAVAGGTWP